MSGKHSAEGTLFHILSVIVTTIHDPIVVAGLERFVSINSAIEIDLTGQVNAEALGGRVRIASGPKGGTSVVVELPRERG